MNAAKGLRGPVVAAIDLADTAGEVLTQAHAVAESLKARLIVCHVLHEVLQAHMLFPQLFSADMARQTAIERQVREKVETRTCMVTQRKADDFDVAVEWGSPPAGILTVAEQTHAGLVVVGAGSVAERVARYAPCAVLVARPSARGTVLGATDFSDPSLPAIETAVAEAERRGAALRLLYSVELAEPVLLGTPTVAVGVVPALPGEIVDGLERGVRERLQESLARFGAKGQCLVSRGAAAAAIVQAARAVPTELVVVGMRGRSNVSRLLLGNVAEAVLRMAPCSVLVVHMAPHGQ